jgi:hypothetical protein
MKFVGLLLAFVGFVIPVVGLTMTQSVGVRMGLCVVGIIITLVGILGVLNQAHKKEAIWNT